MPSKVTSYLLVLFVILLALRSIEAQNCGFPTRPITLDPVREDFEEGKVLEQIRVIHVEDDVQDLLCHDLPFARLETSAEHRQMRLILLGATERLIDKYKFKECRIPVQLKCTDGRKKDITLIFPLEDVNSKSPDFVTSDYPLLVELPWNCNVAVNFHHRLEIEDQDRDFHHAIIDFEYPDNSIFEARATLLGYDKDSIQNHTYKVEIFLKEEYCSDFGTSLALQSFQMSMRVFNPDVPAMMKFMHIKATFTSPPDTFANIPVFSQHIYQETIVLQNWEVGKPLIAVDATIYSDPGIVYEMDENDYFRIDRSTGVVSLKTPPSMDYINSLNHQVGIYHIRASKGPTNENKTKKTTTTLLVFFDVEDSTEIPTSTEYPVTLPGEFQCPGKGNFSDPEFCNIFHVCLPTGGGEYQDNPMCCAFAGEDQYLVFCENLEEPRCETLEHAAEKDCYCHTDSYDDTCPGYPGNTDPTEGPWTGPTEDPTVTGYTGWQDFKCESEGSFKDPNFCNKFHVCLPDGNSYKDYPKCCALAGENLYLVFCENQLEPKCETKEHAEAKGCFCYSDSYDFSCYSDKPQPTQPDQTGTTLEDSWNETTTTAPSGFKCSSEGSFPDPDFCNIYHTCVNTGYDYYDFRQCCASAGQNKFLEYCAPVHSCLTREEAIQKGCECKHDTQDEQGCKKDNIRFTYV